MLNKIFIQQVIKVPCQEVVIDMKVQEEAKAMKERWDKLSTMNLLQGW